MNYNKYFFNVEVEISFNYNNLIRDVSFISTLKKERGYLNWKETNIWVGAKMRERSLGCRSSIELVSSVVSRDVYDLVASCVVYISDFICIYHVASFN